MNDSGPILLFDGVCNLCNRLVIFIIRRDKDAKIKFAALQSETGRYFLKKCNLSAESIDSIVYIEGTGCFLKSTAVLHLLKNIGGTWSLFHGFIVIPKFIRDFFYDLVAKNRYRIFGRSEKCMIPSAEIIARFLRDN